MIKYSLFVYAPISSSKKRKTLDFFLDPSKRGTFHISITSLWNRPKNVSFDNKTRGDYDNRMDVSGCIDSFRQ